MAKLKPKEKPTETPLGRTAQLARKLLRVPKTEVDKRQQAYKQRRRIHS